MIERKYYTPLEVAQTVGIPEGDVYHYIETNQLTGSLLSPRRSYLIVTIEEGDMYVARGQITFAGLLTPHPSWIQKLLEEKKITLNRIAQSAHGNEFRDYSTENPYHSEMLPETISQWIPTSWSDLKSKEVWLFPKPEQRQSYLYQFSEVIQKIGEAQDTKSKAAQSEIMPPQYVFDHYKNGNFELQDLRIAAKHLDRLIRPHVPEDITPPKIGIEVLLWCNSRTRVTRIDPVVERLLVQNFDKTAPELWKLLIEDIGKDEPSYDLESIITEIDSLSLDWITAKNRTRPLTKKTFANKISKLREFHKSAKN